MSPLETNTRLVKTFLSLSVGLSTYSKCHKRGSGGSGLLPVLGTGAVRHHRFESCYPDYLLLVMMEKAGILICQPFFIVLKILQ